MNTATIHRLGTPGAIPRELREPDGRIALALLDKLHRGVIVMAAHGSPLYLNRAATVMLARGDALFLAAGRLTLHDQRARHALQAFLAHTPCDDSGAPVTLALRTERMNGLPAYRLLAMRLDETVAGHGAAAPLYGLFIYEPHAGRFIPTRVLTDLYGLSRAEARLTASLFTGRSLQDSARCLGIATNTARSHLKHVFAKCEVQSQAELLQLLALGPRTC